MNLLRLLVLGTLSAGLAAAAVADPQDPAAPFDLAQYRGKVVLVNFWASWCTHCVDEFPWLGEMKVKYGAGGLVVVAVNVDRNPAEAERVLSAVGGHDLELRSDPDGALAARLKVGGMPENIVFDRTGTERYRFSDFRQRKREDYESHVSEIVGK